MGCVARARSIYMDTVAHCCGGVGDVLSYAGVSQHETDTIYARRRRRLLRGNDATAMRARTAVRTRWRCGGEGATDVMAVLVLNCVEACARSVASCISLAAGA